MKKRIYLSAPALVCCAGQNRNELYESCLTGNQGGLIMHALADTGVKYPTGIITKELPEVGIPEPLAYTGRTKIIRIINEALEQLGPAAEKAIARYGRDRIGVCLGSCDIGSESTFLAQHVLFNESAPPENYSLHFQSASYSAEFISQKFRISGPAFTIATACASGANAVIRGAELIQSGICDAVIAGGADAVTNTVFAGFHALEAISDEPTNPFSKNRKGLNLGEGAAFFLLEAEKNSNIELLGFGESVDACHMTAPGTDGEGPAKAMRAALSYAGIDSRRIGYVNLHGTGTELNDRAEFLAMKIIFGDAPPPFSSTKPITGHTLGAAGTLEAAICWMTINEQRGFPVHCWDGIADSEITFTPVSISDNTRNMKPPSICMSNSFGFGGCNASLILASCI